MPAFYLFKVASGSPRLFADPHNSFAARPLPEIQSLLASSERSIGKKAGSPASIAR